MLTNCVGARFWRFGPDVDVVVAVFGAAVVVGGGSVDGGANGGAGAAAAGVIVVVVAAGVIVVVVVRFGVRADVVATVFRRDVIFRGTKPWVCGGLGSPIKNSSPSIIFVFADVWHFSFLCCEHLYCCVPLIDAGLNL